MTAVFPGPIPGQALPTNPQRSMSEEKQKPVLNPIEEIVAELNAACEQCDEGQSMTLAPFRYISSGEEAAVEFLGTPLWNSDDEVAPGDLRRYIIEEANKTLPAIRALQLPRIEPQPDADDRHEFISLYGWLGEDEEGSGVVGLKQALVPAGCIPLVATTREKMDSADIKTQLHAQAKKYGKTIRLCQFTFASELVRLSHKVP